MTALDDARAEAEAALADWGAMPKTFALEAAYPIATALRALLDASRPRPVERPMSEGGVWGSYVQYLADLEAASRPQEVPAQHDEKCEAEYVAEALGWTECDCATRPQEVPADALSADAPTVPAPELEREDDAPSGVAGHDEQCEAEYLAEATGWLPCGCADRATEGVREDLARLINDRHQSTRGWNDLRSRTGLARTNGDDYAIRTAYVAADAILASFAVTPKGQS